MGCLIAFVIIAVIGGGLATVLIWGLGTGLHKVAKEVDKYVNKKTVAVSMGQPGQSGDMQVTVTSANTWPGADMITPGPGNEFVVVDVQVKVTGSTIKLVSPMSDMSLQTGSNYTYDPSFTGPPPQFPNGEIGGGQTARGMVNFEVPSGTKDLYFIFNPLLKQGDIIKVKIR